MLRTKIWPWKNQALRSGRKGENLACDYLRKQGYRILKRNVSYSFGEIDIVAWDKKRDEYVFVEVKSGAFDSNFHPHMHFDQRKKRQLRKLAKTYLSDHIGEKRRNARIDLCTVRFNKNGKTHIELFEHVDTDTAGFIY